VLVLDGLIAVGAPFFDVWYVRYAFKTPPPDIPLQGGAALIAVVTFVGIWLIQRSRPSVDPLSEMRDAITAAVVVVYLVILAWSSFLPQISKTSNQTLNPLTSTFITNFTALTGVVIGFYFTSTAAAQISANKSKPTADQNAAVNPADTKVS
jgi:drug/metabolite transporter (DMT)-like permease